ncbi:MPN670 family protein [Mycoplasmoides pirum]|uniref:MPN670 family protein n=1 Tax=Mycoplasmoides pirum TaxID=2122 RepID=UPI00047F2ACB|nr:hypothetical protein [Mycoplasmoides pirum]
MKQSNKKSFQEKLDLIFLDPKNYKRIGTIGSFIAFLIFIGFILNQVVLFKQPSKTPYYVLLGILIFFTVLIFILAIVLTNLKNKRYKNFNNINHESFLIEKIKMNSEVELIEEVDSKNNELIPGEFLFSSYIPNFFNFVKQSNDYFLKIKNSKAPFQFTVVTYNNDLKYSKLTLSNNKKILLIKLPSFINEKFYLCKQTINFKNPKTLIINSYEFSLEFSEQNYFVYIGENSSRTSIEKLNKQILNEVLFDPTKTNASFDLYNDEKNAYLICLVPDTFMDSSLRPNESIKNFETNLTKQSEYDLLVLTFIEKIVEILTNNLIT